MAKATPFKKPEEIKVEKTKRVPVSIRLDESIKSALEVAASRTPDQLLLAPFVEQILIQYVHYLEQKPKNGRRG